MRGGARGGECPAGWAGCESDSVRGGGGGFVIVSGLELAVI
jgi:hypothetical protein